MQESFAPGRQDGRYVSTVGDGAVVCGACDKDTVVGSSEGNSSEDQGNDATTDDANDGRVPAVPTVSPQERTEQPPSQERSPFVSIGGGLVALDLPIPSRFGYRPA
jgi:hypothetical protein